MTPGSGSRHPLDLDRVLPAVAEVVEIAQRLGSGVFEHVDEFGLAGVERSVGPIGTGKAPARVAGADFEEVAVGPAQRGLERQMQPVELDVGRNLDPTQNLGLDVVERDFEAENGGGHAASLRRSRSAAQFQGMSSSSRCTG